jgi:hypothetical protein
MLVQSIEILRSLQAGARFGLLRLLMTRA